MIYTIKGVLDIRHAQADLPKLAAHVANGRGVRIVNDKQKMLLLDEDTLPAELADTLWHVLEKQKSMDETAYLMSNPANVERLLESRRQMKAKQKNV